MSLRNVGAGMAVLRGWSPAVEVVGSGEASAGPADPDEFRMQTRDLYVPAGDVSFWQGAIRDEGDPDYSGIARAIADRRPLTIDLLYGDHEGGQRTISRFLAIPRDGDQDGIQWLCLVSRHWNLDRSNPR